MKHKLIMENWKKFLTEEHSDQQKYELGRRWSQQEMEDQHDIAPDWLDDAYEVTVAMQKSGEIASGTPPEELAKKYSSGNLELEKFLIVNIMLHRLRGNLGDRGLA